MRPHSLLALALTAAATTTLRAQSSTCRAADDESARLISAAKLMVTSTDSRWIQARNAYQLSVVPDTAIALVTDDSVCAQAGSAYNSALADGLRHERSLYVVRVGDRYVVEDPSTDASGAEYRLIVTLSSAFVVLAKGAA